MTGPARAAHIWAVRRAGPGVDTQTRAHQTVQCSETHRVTPATHAVGVKQLSTQAGRRDGKVLVKNWKYSAIVIVIELE